MSLRSRIVALIAFASWSTGIAAEAADVTPHERQILNAIKACEQDSSPDWCAPFRPLIAHIAAQSGPTEAETVEAVHESRVGLGRAARADPNQPLREAVPAAFASGHGARAPGEPPKPARDADFTVSAASDTKNATLTLDLDLSKKFGGRPYDLSLTAQTPLGQGATYQNLATLDGLAASTALELKLTRLFVSSTTQHQAQNTEYYQRACVGLLDAIHGAAPGVKINPNWYAKDGCNAGDVSYLLTQVKLPDDVTKAIAAGVDDLDALNRPIINSMVLLSGNVKVGYESHSFYDPQKLDPAVFNPNKHDPESLDRTTYQIGVAATYVFHGGDMSVGAAFNYQRAYKDGGDKGETKTLCPVQSVSILTCVTGYMGHPLRTEQDLLSAEYRYILPPVFFHLPFGVDPTLTYDFHSHAYGFQLPIYVAAAADKSLTGGIRYDWTSDRHHSVVGLFITSAFCVLPGYSGCTPAASSSAADGS